jgi:hypothetical protein
MQVVDNNRITLNALLGSNHPLPYKNKPDFVIFLLYAVYIACGASINPGVKISGVIPGGF